MYVAISLELELFYEAVSAPAPFSPEVEKGRALYARFMGALGPCEHCGLWGNWALCARCIQARRLVTNQVQTVADACETRGFAGLMAESMLHC